MAVTVKNLFLLLVFMITSATWAKDDNNVSIDVLTKTTRSWDGSVLPAYPTGKPEVTILKITVQPKVTLPWHKHPIINAGVMIKGELTVITKENEKLHLKAGDTIVEIVDKWHRGTNEGTVPAEIIVFYAGVIKTPLSINHE